MDDEEVAESWEEAADSGVNMRQLRFLRAFTNYLFSVESLAWSIRTNHANGFMLAR